MVDRDVVGYAQQPGSKTCQLPPITVTRPPGLLESPGGQLLDIGLIALSIAAQPVVEVVVDPGQLCREHRVPVSLGCGAPPDSPASSFSIVAHT